MKKNFQCLIVFFLLQAHAIAKNLPIYIEDSHAGSFGFFAQQLDLESSYTLVLFDAHSDASGIPGSDKIRQAIRKVHTFRHRQQKISELRGKGVIQPFNWIEPLMPNPISKVIWIAADSLSDEQISELQKEARVQLDWHLQARQREAGALAKHYVVTDWQRFQQEEKEKLGDILLSIDLDYFANIKQGAENLDQKWKEIVQWKRLEAVSFAISMPWQKNKQIADQLLFTAFKNAFSVKGSRIQYEPFLSDIRDRSEMAKSYFSKAQSPPRYKIAEATQQLRELLVRNETSLLVKHGTLEWEALLHKWGKSGQQHKLEIRTAQQSIDGVWRLKNTESHDVFIADRDQNAIKVRWWLIRPEYDNYNIMPRSGLGKGFTENAPAYITSKRILIAETEDQALSSRTWTKQLHTTRKIGVVRLQAELIRENDSTFTNIIEIRVRENEGVLGALEEQFGSPYVFGIGRMKYHGESGPETLLGNDCANFLIYAMRRNGKRLPWCNPAQIKTYLDEVAGNIQSGDVVHLGSHVALIYQDSKPIGVLDSNDTLVHHLGGVPEFTSIDKLAKGKPYTIMRWKKSRNVSSFLMGGDVCLHGESVAMPQSLIKRLENDTLIANLECVISDHAQPLMKKRFNYIIPSKKAEESQSFSKVSVYSLANNHAGDGGVKGLTDTMTFLNEKGIAHFGAGKLKQATAVRIIQINGEKIGLIGMNLIEGDALPATEHSIGIATYPLHKKPLARSIQRARRAGVKYIIAMPHWGDEYTKKVNDSQRELAKWLIRQGVDAVVGSHPHILQHSEFYRGRSIHYSLGNLVFASQRRKGFNLRSLLMFSTSHYPSQLQPELIPRL